MGTKFILLWLEAPIQSWGFDSKFGRRDTLNFPTKSGILGLVCCAMGATGEQVKLLKEFSELKQTVISYVRAKKDKNGNIIKTPREPLLHDFQMIGSGYDNKDPWQSLLIPKTAEGKPAVGGGTKLTHRYYLQDAVFAVILEVPNSLAEAVSEALQNPVYDIYLGRKCCVPSDFIYQGLYTSEDDAQIAAEKKAESKQHDNIFLIKDFTVIDGECNEGDSFTLNDVPIQFGKIKKYSDRRVTVITL